jgi:signal transduction histidine kinase
MKIRYLLGVAILASSLAATALYAQATGTAAEAKAMLEKGIAALKANKADAIKQFNTSPGPFRDRDLYVFCYNTSDGKFTAHPNAKLMGTDIRALKDPTGTPLGENIYKGAKEGTITTTDYSFPKPGTDGPPVPKQSFITVVGDQGCGVGYYK